MEGLFSDEVYEEHIVPQVVELYTLHDLPVRRLLLLHLPHYLHLISKDQLQKDVVSITSKTAREAFMSCAAALEAFMSCAAALEAVMSCAAAREAVMQLLKQLSAVLQLVKHL